MSEPPLVITHRWAQNAGTHLRGCQRCQREKWGWERPGGVSGSVALLWRRWQVPGLADVPKTASQGTRFCTNTLTSVGCQQGQRRRPSPRRCARLGCFHHAARGGLPWGTVGPTGQRGREFCGTAAGGGLWTPTLPRFVTFLLWGRVCRSVGCSSGRCGLVTGLCGAGRAGAVPVGGTQGLAAAWG